MNGNDFPPSESVPPVSHLRMSARAGSPTASFNLRVVAADDIEVEDSATMKFLRLRNGDFALPKSVFLVVDGERHEITIDALPESE